jgi:hypothetical protein
MIDARTLLLAAQTRSEAGDIATANLLRDAALEIAGLRSALADVKRSAHLRHAQAIAEAALDDGKHWTDKT